MSKPRHEVKPILISPAVEPALMEPALIEIPFSVGSGDHHWLIHEYAGYRPLYGDPDCDLVEGPMNTAGISVHAECPVILDAVMMRGVSMMAHVIGCGVVLQEQDGMIHVDWGLLKMGDEIRIRLKGLQRVTGTMAIYGLVLDHE